MKKYLMTGVAALAFAATFTSCSKSGDLYDEGRIEKEKEVAIKNDFASQFEAKFGEPAKDHHWGFFDKTVPSIAAGTRSHNVNRNEWGTGDNSKVGGHVVIPNNVTQAEHDLVLTEFSKKRENVTVIEQINWNDFFVHQVHRSENTYRDGFNQEFVVGDNMNQLKVYFSEDDMVGEHVNDFNQGTQTANWETIIGATYMENSGTAKFSYHNVKDSKDHFEYIIISGANIDASLAGYYYVGFDFYAQHPEGQEANKNMDVERDWIFNDWIVRISPAEFDDSQRIIAEDLSANDGSDFDYNDVVFDARLQNEYVASENNNMLVAHITLRAAGGTMPLYIGGKEKGKEVHALFGVDTGTMVNTNKGTVSKAPVPFTIVLRTALAWNETYNVKDIPVVVDGRNGTITLGSEIGQASEKLCVTPSFQWCDERDPIDTVYPLFKNWVREGDSLKWY